jgi:hypothetical protein
MKIFSIETDRKYLHILYNHTPKENFLYFYIYILFMKYLIVINKLFIHV